MSNAFMNLVGLMTLGGFAAMAWVLLGRAARAAGTGRLQVLGAAALVGWLLG